MVQRRLGRGLDYLISGQARPGDDELLEVALDDLRPNPYQPRREFDDADLADLARSIAAHGVLQPIVVRRVAVGYEIVAGERRFRASKQLGLPSVPAIVRAATDDQLLELAIVENIQRADLNPIETGRAYAALIKRLGLTQGEAAERVGKSRSAVANTIRLLDLPDELQAHVSAGRLSAGHARALLAVDDPERQLALGARIVAEGLSVREVEAAVKAPAPAPTADRAVPGSRSRDDESREAHLEDLESQLREALGTRVRIRGRAEKGRIEIDYYSAADLDRLLGQLLSS